MSLPSHHATAFVQPVFDEPVFNEGKFTPDPSQFKIKHPSDSKLYKQLGDALTKNAVNFPASRGNADDIYTLQQALGAHGPDVIKNIQKNEQIVFHSVGDTGAANAGKYQNEIRVSDQITQDSHTTNGADRPAFLFHLGDVIYDFGESKYYYDQFYEPFRNYPNPIFAIPGNHDSFIVPGTPPDGIPLDIFIRNFCAEAPQITPEAASLHRTAMTQPGVYFTLDAPFVRVIGLFSNALEDPGLISSESGQWPHVSDLQLAFLSAQLDRIAKEKYAGAVIIATHHPSFVYAPQTPERHYGADHGSSLGVLRQIDGLCQEAGVYPHAFLAGHAHNYQRYTRTIKWKKAEFEVPLIVCGSGGHNIAPLLMPKHGQMPPKPSFGEKVSYLDIKPAITASSLVLEKYDDRNYGYLRISVTKDQLNIGFHQVLSNNLLQSRFDSVTVDLASHRITP